MAFYQDVPGRRPVKKNHNQGSWEDEGSRYRGGARRFGPDAEEDDALNAPRRYGDRQNRSSFGAKDRGSRPSYGERRYDSRPTRGDRPNRGDNRRAPEYASPRDGRRDSRGQENRRPAPASRPVQAESARQPSYRDFEHKPAPVAVPVEAPVVNENLLTGRNPIREALKSGRDLEKLLVQRGELSGSARAIVQMAKEAHIPVQEVEKARLDEIAPHHQGMLAFASAYQYSSVEAMLETARQRSEDPFLILLDGVTDPHNLGAIIRSAECAGAHGVIVPERRSVGLTPTAVKASAGAIEHMKVARVTNLNRTLEELKDQGVWAYAVTMDGEDYEKVNFKGGVALVIGAEGEGISRLTLEKCDQRVSLPMKGCIDSLNASVAAGIMMYRVLSTRKA